MDRYTRAEGLVQKTWRFLLKEEIAKELAKRTGIRIGKAYDLTVALLEIIKDTIVKTGNVELRGFGTFRVRQTPARKYKNAKKEWCEAPAKNKVYYKASKTLIEEINEIKPSVASPGKSLLCRIPGKEDSIEEREGV